MPASDTTKKIVLGCVAVGAAAVVGATLYYKFIRKEDAEEDLHFSKTVITAKVDEGPKQADTKPPSAPSGGGLNLDALADELLTQQTSSAPGEVYETFPDIGLKCKVPEGWEAASEDGPTPQIAIVKLFPKGMTEEQRMDPMPFGRYPNIMLMVEDTAEAMSAKDYKDRSKEMAIRTGQGMMQISGDHAVKIGPFEYQLEGMQPIPDPSMGRIMHIKFLNLLTTRDSCGYAVQYIAADDSFGEHLKFVQEWASTIELLPLVPRQKSFLEYTNSAHEVQVCVPWSWSVLKDNRELSDGRIVVVSFKTSGEKTDTITMYKAKSPCESSQAHLEQHVKAAGGTPSNVTAAGPVAQGTYVADGKELKLLCTEAYALEVKPETKKSKLEDAVLREILGSVKLATAEANLIRYVNHHYRFAFAITPDCSLAEFKFGNTTLMYSPVPQPAEDSEASIPILKVFVNKEQEHYEDLKAVELKLREASDPGTPMQDCRIETFQGRDWLSFTTSFQDGPYGMFGPREEYKSKMFICLRDNESFMLKWELAANEWRRYERFLTQIMESFDISV